MYDVHVLVVGACMCMASDESVAYHADSHQVHLLHPHQGHRAHLSHQHHQAHHADLGHPDLRCHPEQKHNKV